MLENFVSMSVQEPAIAMAFASLATFIDFAISKKHKFHWLSKIFREVINYVGFAISKIHK